jgi:Mn-dependent DtxR family transcriptional regulator
MTTSQWQPQRVLRLLREKGEVGAGKVARELSINLESAVYALNTLAQEGQVVKRGGMHPLDFPHPPLFKVK